MRRVLLPPSEGTSLTYERKLREAILAYQVSREYSKDQILSVYLNEVYYGNQAYGVEAAAQGYFGKHVWELSLAEASLIAGLPQSPTALDPFHNLEGAKERQRVTLNQMVKNGYVTPQQAIDAFNAPLNLVPPASDILAPHFVFYVREVLEQRYGADMLYRGGLRVVTTLDPRWQAEAQRIAMQHIAELAPRNATNASVMMMAPDGQILAMLGSVDYNNPAIDGQVNVALSPRQPGSALKPIVYAAAMQRGWTPATVIWDTPVSFPGVNGGPSYEPLNYDNSFHGPMRLRMALANSLNIPAVKALEFVGRQQLRRAGPRDGHHHYERPRYVRPADGPGQQRGAPAGSDGGLQHLLERRALPGAAGAFEGDEQPRRGARELRARPRPARCSAPKASSSPTSSPTSLATTRRASSCSALAT